MAASEFVGRVGGLAVALGVGAAMFSGSAVAWADRGPDTSGDTDSASSAPARTHRGAVTQNTSPSSGSATNRGSVTQQDSTPTVTLDQVKSDPAPAAAVIPAASLPAPSASTSTDVDPVPAPVVNNTAPDPIDVPAVTPNPVVITDPVVNEPLPVVLVHDPAPESAPAGDLSVITLATGSDGSNGAGNGPSTPVDSPLVAAYLAASRRLASPSAATDQPGALVTSSATANASSPRLSVAPGPTVYFDGVLQGNLNVTSASGCGSVGSDCKLAYSLAGSSAGGKANFNNVPGSLPQGGAGSYTFLPYATWIDPASPTKFPTPTGTQDFTVRVSENTKFDQTLAAVPLLGQLVFKPIIDLLQTTPFIGDLLAPLIGASIKQTISVNVGTLAAGKQVAYTYKVTSFDGTKISMNYFPASTPSLLPLLGNQQATIFNGPGLGSPGETNPYGSFQAAGSTPGLALMRGQGLPGDFASAPLGFNVITWDPRGEWDSGGVLQLDNPFFEGRDVSSLIDWANVNTPLLNEGSPDIAMMGGSYGGGIQMTTVDPRIKSIVPAIAWNSLNNSLYPGGIFKTAWANVLAETLLLTGASSLDRVNSQITEALITGNLFAFISETAQAVLASSGPTALLTKLNVPTMYNQGIVDALFPLQQALDNARTQLEDNPFFLGSNKKLVKMIWFCGGHGVCTTFTPAQQTAQATTMFLENMLWVNKYTKDYLAGIPAVIDPINSLISAIAPFQWWDQKGTKLASFAGMPYTAAFQNTPVITAVNATGGSINSFTSRSGPLTADDPAGAACAGVASACEFPLNQVFATKAKNAVNVDIPIATQKYVVGAPTVSFTYSGIGNAKAVYAQIVDNETGQVLGNINTAIPVTLDGKEHTVTDFSIANIAYTSPASGGKGLTLQFIANSALYQNTSVNWNVNISKISVNLPTTGTAIPNPFPF